MIESRGTDFTLTGDFGEVPKQQQLDRVRHRKEYASTAHLIVADERFRFYGDAALLTEVERYGDGEDFPDTKRLASGSSKVGTGS